MRSNSLETIWSDIEVKCYSETKTFQQLVYTDLIYRVYIGTTGMPYRRFVLIEIPKLDERKFNSFSSTEGFVLSVVESEIKHKEFVSCLLQSSSSEQNDVFTVVVKDILNELRSQNNAKSYVKALENRILKWKYFFRNPTQHLLNDNQVIGLIGELLFVSDLINRGNNSVIDYWNGPIGAAQDIQCDSVAIEVKAKTTSKIEKVTISNEMQLDPVGRESLYLVVYRLERNDANGILLPVLIKSIKNRLDNQKLTGFEAKLLCLGYKEQDANKYYKGYVLKETKIYKVLDGFPNIIRENLSSEVSNVKYNIDLTHCDEFESDVNEIINSIEEYENGQI